MFLIRWITGLFSGGGGGRGGNGRVLPIYVLSRRCNEPIAGQIDLYNELSLDEEETGYFCRKVLHTSGERRCFDQVDVTVNFDRNKKVVDHEVVGGRWLSEAEYEQELVRFNTPPDSDDDVLPTLPAGPDPEIIGPEISSIEAGDTPPSENPVAVDTPPTPADESATGQPDDAKPGSPQSDGTAT